MQKIEKVQPTQTKKYYPQENKNKDQSFNDKEKTKENSNKKEEENKSEKKKINKKKMAVLDEKTLLYGPNGLKKFYDIVMNTDFKSSKEVIIYKKIFCVY